MNPTTNITKPDASAQFPPEVFATLSKLGLAVVIVMFENVKPGHPALNRGNLAGKLGRELQGWGAGQYDSTFYHGEQHWHFYHATKLAKAIEVLNAYLDRLGLLKYATIFTVESPNELIPWHPPTAKRITFSE